MFDLNTFNNCLRIYIQPNHFEDEQIAGVVDFCKKYNFKNVMLFINAEEFNYGHITKEESAPILAVMKKAKKVFHENGISLGLNPWIELGHLDRGRSLKDGQNFVTMRDMNGISSELVACPLDEEWRKYYFDILTYYLQEIQPDMYWIEDDFRLHNHGFLEFGGCFCKEHVKWFNEKLGKNYTHAELVSKIFAPGALTPERKVWLDCSREMMRELAEKIGETAKNSGYDGYMGLMSSCPDLHCMEARDWHGIHDAFALKGVYINRQGMPPYQEVCGKECYYTFNKMCMIIRTFIPEDTYIYPELENAAFSTFSKDPEFLRFQVEYSLPLLVSGMTYDIFGFTANGVVEGFGYGEQVASITPYMEAVRKLGIKFSTLSGVVLPVREDSSYHQIIKSGWGDLLPKEFNIAGYLGALGINYKPSTAETFENKVLYLTEGNVRYFTKEELKDIAEHNYVVLDGAGAKTVLEKGAGDIFGIEDIEVIAFTSGVKSYEQIDNHLKVFGIPNYRATAQEKVGDYYKITYSRPVEEVSNLYNRFNEKVGHGMVKTGNCFIIPFDTSQVFASSNGLASASGGWGDWYTRIELFSDIRKVALQDFLMHTNVQTPLIFTDYLGVYSYFYQKDNGVAMFVNSTLHHLDELKLKIKNISFNDVYVIDRKDGVKKRVNYRIEDGQLIIEDALLPLSTKTVIFE